MGVVIGNITVAGKIDELRKNSIYCIDSLHEKIKNRIPLDYDFLLIDGKRHINGNHQCIFITAIKCIFNNDKPSKDLNETIIGELGSVTWDTGDDKKEIGPEDQKHIFRWLSRILERLPGRIFIVGAEEPDGWEEISKKKNQSREHLAEDEQINLCLIKLWLTRRIVWISDIKSRFNGLKIEYRINEVPKPESWSAKSKAEKKSGEIPPSVFQNFLWAAWLNHLSTESDFEMGITFDVESPEISLEEVKNNFKDWVYKYYDRINACGKYSLADFEALFLLPFKYYYEDDVDYPVDKYIDYLNSENNGGGGNADCRINKFIKLLDEDVANTDRVKVKYFLNVLEKFFLKINQPSDPTKLAIRPAAKMPSLFTTPSSVVVRKITDFKLKFAKEPPDQKGSDQSDNYGHKNQILYFRHGIQDMEFEDKKTFRRVFKEKKDADNSGQSFLYYEKLSGSAFHYQLIHSGLNKAVKKDEIDDGQLLTLFNLAENGLLKIVVIDERIANFVDNEEKATQFEYCGIKVLRGIKKLGKISGFQDFVENHPFLDTFEDIKEDVLNGSYDVLIIHQGILDKIQNQKYRVEEEDINTWKLEYFPHIIVTSGRGTPENVPINCKFVPFSNIETTLISNPPSKYLLTRMIFKIISSTKEGKNE